ncbi:MAG: helix-hairpin-helix domain-containing protein [Oscillospiraceae bacterium]|nr:helix-hairpin-helix domain-containing protein [Oscillospiraceae bacterium]
MENKEPNNNDDDKKVTIFFFLIAASIIFGFFIFPNIYEKYDDKPVVIYTLSKEQLEGYGYTTKGNLDTDIWEDDNADDSYNLGNTETEFTETVLVTDSLTSEYTRVTVSFPLDINFANAEELMMVRGIGEITANKIVDYRGINGYFYSMDELLNIDGIGEKKLAALKGYLYIDHELLPETLPYTPEFNIYNDEDSTVIVTTVPQYNNETMITVVGTEAITEDFIMETEEFVTDIDKEFETDNYEVQYSYPENFNVFDITESEYYPNFPIELNSASVKDLTYIKGIGESTANKIVEYARNIGFTTVDDLLNISGIGKNKLESIRSYVYVVSYTTTYESEFSSTQSLTQSETSYNTYKVNINTCNKDDLMQLPGIDETLADNILELRAQIIYFKNIEELSFALSNEKLSEIWDYVYV